MNVKNIALVRATNIIPIDGVVHPISEVPYLCKENGSTFAFAMSTLLKKQGKLKKIDYSKPDEGAAQIKENSKVLNEYMPYSSSYNSMVLWSLNGLVPDDMNNTFSNKTCAIIERLEEQIDKSNVISLMPTDTGIKGRVNLSKHSSILISKERYESLSQDKKDELSKLCLNITAFDGDLNQAVNEELKKQGISPETLTLNRDDNGYVKSDTSDELKNTINDIAKEKNIPQMLHWNILTRQSDELDKLADVKDEFKNICLVDDFYRDNFMDYLFSKMDIDEQVKFEVDSYPESPVYMENLCNEIERIGIEEYKEILDKYNGSLEKLQKEGNLPTPQEIVDSIRNNQKIDLISKIEELGEQQNEQSKGKELLASGVEETEKSTTKCGIENQEKEIEANKKEKQEKIKI